MKQVIKPGDMYIDAIGRIHQIYRIASSESDIKKYYNNDKNDDRVFWELETIKIPDNEYIPNGRINTYWKQASYIRENYKLLTNKTNYMNTFKNTIKNLMRTEPEKTFVEVGFLDQEENITSKGREALEFILWEKHKDELKKLADQIVSKDSDR